jgi:hypothetical protein
VVDLMDLWKIIGRSYHLVRLALLYFLQALVSPAVNILHKNFVEGRYGHTSRSGRITKYLQNYFSKSCLFTNAMVKTNLKSKYAWKGNMR